MERPVVGVDVGGTKMLMIAKWHRTTESKQLPTGPDLTAKEVEQAILEFVHKLPCPPKGIGVAVAGLVDSGDEIISCEVLPGLLHWTPKKAFESLYPVIVMNDAMAALMEETHDLPLRSTAAVIMIGTGTGAALLVDGQPVAGARGWAGELGSIPISLLAGGVKSLNDYASGRSILQDLRVNIDELLKLIVEEDKRAIDRVRLAGKALGFGIATLVNLLNPHRVVFGGLPTTLPFYAEAAIAAAQSHSFPLLWEACEVYRSVHGGMSVALGAARAAGNLKAVS